MRVHCHDCILGEFHRLPKSDVDFDCIYNPPRHIPPVYYYLSHFTEPPL